jgi:hypothetical protein
LTNSPTFCLPIIEPVTGVARELGIGPTEGSEVMAILNSLSADIVTTERFNQ